jgi:hypothetical protein
MPRAQVMSRRTRCRFAASRCGLVTPPQACADSVCVRRTVERSATKPKLCARGVPSRIGRRSFARRLVGNFAGRDGRLRRICETKPKASWISTRTWTSCLLRFAFSSPIIECVLKVHKRLPCSIYIWLALAWLATECSHYRRHSPLTGAGVLRSMFVQPGCTWMTSRISFQPWLPDRMNQRLALPSRARVPTVVCRNRKPSCIPDLLVDKLVLTGGTNDNGWSF